MSGEETGPFRFYTLAGVPSSVGLLRLNAFPGLKPGKTCDPGPVLAPRMASFGVSIFDFSQPINPLCGVSRWQRAVICN